MTTEHRLRATTTFCACLHEDEVKTDAAGVVGLFATRIGIVCGHRGPDGGRQKGGIPMVAHHESDEEFAKAVKTYRYLRLGMIGMVVMLAASLLIEAAAAPGCWQTSISAYFYTPVRAVFVGVLMTIGLALFVLKGRTDWEDTWLNLAGMCAPIVALVPTTDVGTCSSSNGSPMPIKGERIPGWLIDLVRNNGRALSVFFIIAFAIGIAKSWRRMSQMRRAPITGSVLSLVVLLALSYVWISPRWVTAHLHGSSAVAMFVFLWGAVVSNLLGHRKERNTAAFRWYLAIAIGMVISAPIGLLFGDHKVLVIEALEIGWFVLFWAVQTARAWGSLQPSRSLLPTAS
jgi:hypothetical protein